MKLNILPPVSVVKQLPVEKKDNGYKSPVRWWRVTTESRTTKDLGSFYGHVAEIALHLANKCCYSLNFTVVDNPVEITTRLVYQATRTEVHINLGIESGTWPDSGMGNAARVEWFRKWLDTDDVKVKGCPYYAAVTIVLS